MSAPLRRLLVALFIVGAAGAVVGYVFYGRALPGRPPLGMVRQTDIRIAPELSGRLVFLPVRPGQKVREGEVLALIDNPEIAASLGEAKAAAASAKAERDRIYSGVRAEEVAILSEAVRTAKANLLLAQEMNTRVATLSGRGFASAQQLDEANASLAKAKADLAGKEAQHAAAAAGPTAEERALADARVALAEAGVAELEASLAKTRIVAPVDGTVGVQVAELGEILSPGKPIMTLAADGKTWFSFTLREDALAGLSVGAEAALTRADGRKISGRVATLIPLGEFATWRAARAVGDHDLNSFRLRIEPSGPVEGLDPGMTVWLAPEGK